MKRWILLFILLPSILFGQNLDFSVGMNKGIGFHNINIDFYQKYYESFLEYCLDGNTFNMQVEFDIHNVKLNYEFKNATYKGVVWDTDFEMGMINSRMDALGKSASNLHLIELGYIFNYKHVDVTLFLSQFWFDLEHNMTGGNIYIGGWWYYNKPIIGLNSVYTDENSGYGMGIEFDFWRIKSKLNYFHRVKNKGTGWWNLREMTFTLHTYLDYYKGYVKFNVINQKFFDISLNYSFDVFHSIGGKWDTNRTITNIENYESNSDVSKNMKFHHSVGINFVLNI